MTNVVRLEDIEEFLLVRRLPRAAITVEISEGVRQLDERSQIEALLRSILPDPTETAHSSTEIADILTTHVTYDGRPHHAAFVNKGKSTTKVTRKNVGHQVLRLRDLSHLDLMVLLAVGDIQDDIKQVLMMQARDASADYLIVDLVDVARLFIAYRKICPRDGRAFVNSVCPNCGLKAEEPIKLTIDVFEQPTYQIIDRSDISTGIAKRYTANILTDRHYQRMILREVIRNAIWELRHDNYYRSEITEQAFGERPADVVALFIYVDLGDKQTGNWICRAQWINPELPERFGPLRWSGEMLDGGIIIDWNNSNDTMRSSHSRSTKQQWVRKVEPLFPELQRLAALAATAFDTRRSGESSQNEFERQMTEWEPAALDASKRAEGNQLAPLECAEADRSLQQLATTVHNIYVPFAAWGRSRRDWKYHEWHLSTYLAQYQENLRDFEYEWRKAR